MRKLPFLFIGILLSIQALSQTTTSLSASSAKLCAGEPVRLTAVGCEKQVLWSNGKTGKSIVDTLSKTATYTAVCMEGENILFSFNQTIKVEVEALPETPYLFCNGEIIKKGEQINIKTFGCVGTVKWSNGQEGREITVSPEKTTTYTAVCYNDAGCAASPISKTIVVEDGTATTPEVSWRYGCTGENVIMTANGCTAGVYVWYKHTLFAGNVTRSQEIGQGASVEVSEGGESIFYTARCLFQDCLGDESNRLFIDFSNKINTPTVQKELIVNPANPTPVDLNTALAKPQTSGGFYEFYLVKDSKTNPMTNAKSVTSTGSYYVVEKSRQGKCISSFATIVVKAGTPTQGAAPTDEVATTKPETSETATDPKTSQVTDTGATLSSSEPNDNLSDLGVPEAFSPNGDGANDVFVIKNLGNKKVGLRVYNRFGHLVYTADEYKNDWNGTANSGTFTNAAVGLPDGTYYYVLMVNDGRQKISFLTIAR